MALHFREHGHPKHLDTLTQYRFYLQFRIFSDPNIIPGLGIDINVRSRNHHPSSQTAVQIPIIS